VSEIASALRFAKGHGTHNDFVIIDDLEGELSLSPAQIQAICDRRGGIGADGVLRVVRTASFPALVALGDLTEAEYFMDYTNADGSVSAMCGNGIRVFARHLVDEGLVDADVIRIATRDGVKTVTLDEGGATVDMGVVELVEGDAEVSVDDRTWPAIAVLAGNPNAVAFVDDLNDAGSLLDPPGLQPARMFPDSANVEFVVRIGERHLAMRVFERGSGETRSCGTGAVAAAFASAHHFGDTGHRSEWRVDVPGGRLTVTLSGDRAQLAGNAVIVAHGVLDADLLAVRA
jgi:diaminopimelate epimerase